MISSRAQLGVLSSFEFGGNGAGSGLLGSIDALRWAADGTLYVWDKTNALIQHFDAGGNFLGQTTAPAVANLCLDATGATYTYVAGIVRKYVGATVVWQAVVQSSGGLACVGSVNGQSLLFLVPTVGTQILVLSAHTGAKLPPITSAQSFVQTRQCDYVGYSLYALDGDTLYCLNADGSLAYAVGNAAADATTVDVFGVNQQTGKVYWFSLAGTVCELTGTTDLNYAAVGFQVGGDPFSYSGSRGVLSFDGAGNIWVGSSTGSPHYRPCIAKIVYATLQASYSYLCLLTVGNTLAVTCGTPYGLSYNLSPVTCSLAYSGRGPVTLEWRADDAEGYLVARGTVPNVASGSTVTVTFTPLRYCGYTLAASAIYESIRVASGATLVSVVPDGARLPTTFTDAEIDLTAWGGLGLLRLDTGSGAAALATRIAYAQSKGLTFVIQFPYDADAAPANCTAYATQFPGQTWEIVNEPNPDANYVTNVLAPAYAALKAADPTCKVMGPQAVHIDPVAVAAFIAAGGLNYIDVWATHDYQGNEEIDNVVYLEAFAAVRAALNAAGKTTMQMWQTERENLGYRGLCYNGPLQAHWLTKHQNMLASVGIPVEHNAHFYAIDHGFDDVPSWLLGSEGMMPAVAMTRQRLTHVGAKPLLQVLDFGPVRNRVQVGLVYGDTSGKVVVLQSYGSADEPVTVAVTAAAGSQAWDAWGNASPVGTASGTVGLTVGPYPSYLTLPAAATVSLVSETFGANLALNAAVTSSAPTLAGALSSVTCGTLYGPYSGGPSSGTCWSADASTLPQTVTVTLSAPQTVTRAAVFSLCADNQYCALLAYDVQAYVGSAWVTVDRCDFYVPHVWYGQTRVLTGNVIKVIQVYPGYSKKVHRFAPVTASQFRLSVRRVSYGLAADNLSSTYFLPPQIQLRQFELYA